MDEKLVKFLKKKGSTEMVCILPIDGYSRREFEERLSISNKTVGSRLEEGVNSGVWTREASHRDVAARYDYFLTERGAYAQIAMVFHQLPTISAELRAKEKEFERQKEAVLNRFEEEKSVENVVRQYNKKLFELEDDSGDDGDAE
jgi:DNA-binding HxlR family transcriptional regulator